LKDIDFEVQQGDVLGIIGKNGAGKSTLLKILSKVTAPTTGKISARGRIASLLEVGTGFHPEMTGRENIYMNGAIMGMTKAEINRKLDEIVDFSGIERYIDTPAKRYSSGMTVRLGFAIAAHLEPEILVVDEVLAVGDAEFQKKAIGKMQDISKGEGRTVLFVSHNMDSMLNLCKSGILLENGAIIHRSNIIDCVNSYLDKSTKIVEYNVNESNKNIFFKHVFCLNFDYKQSKSNSYFFNESVILKLEIQTKIILIPKNTIVDISVFNNKNILLFTVEHELNFSMMNNNSTSLVVKFPANLIAPGSYYFECSIHEPNVSIFDFVNEACSFTIYDSDTQYLKYNGVNQGCFYINAEWN